jgi:hypothetical protein
VGKKDEAVEPGADLICPHCELPIARVDAVSRDVNKRGVSFIRGHVVALACPSCRRLLGFFPG